MSTPILTALNKAKQQLLKTLPGDYISTGSLALDYHLGGGVPRQGKTTVLWGNQGSFKTTVASRVAANALSYGIPVLWYAAETFQKFTELNGLNFNDENLIIIDPTNSTEVARAMIGTKGDYWPTIETLVKIVSSGSFSEIIAERGGLVVLDSWSALLSDAEWHGIVSEGESPAGRAFPIKQAVAARLLPVLKGHFARQNVGMLSISHASTNIDRQSQWDPTHKLGGGVAYLHNADLIARMIIGDRLTKSARIGEDDGLTGRWIKVSVQKSRENSTGALEKSTDIPLDFSGHGTYVNIIEDLLAAGIATKIIENQGNGRYSIPLLGDSAKYHGEQKVKDAISENRAEIADAIISVIQGDSVYIKDMAHGCE